MTKRLEGFQKPRGQSVKPVGLAVVKTDGGVASCSCGWEYGHTRDKVREDAVDRHLDKKHNGRGIRL
jgi:hypothetical protein